MDEKTQLSAKREPVSGDSVFRDLRKRNEYHARVARMLEANRMRRIDQVVATQRKHRTDQAR